MRGKLGGGRYDPRADYSQGSSLPRCQWRAFSHQESCAAASGGFCPADPGERPWLCLSQTSSMVLSRFSDQLITCRRGRMVRG